MSGMRSTSLTEQETDKDTGMQLCARQAGTMYSHHWKSTGLKERHRDKTVHDGGRAGPNNPAGIGTGASTDGADATASRYIQAQLRAQTEDTSIALSCESPGQCTPAPSAQR